MSDPYFNAIDEHWPNIRALYMTYESEKPIILNDIQENKIFSYLYKEFKEDLSEKSQVSLEAANATETPCTTPPTASLPTSFGPCCVNCANDSCDETSRTAKARIDVPKTLDDLKCEIGQTGAVIGTASQRYRCRGMSNNHISPPASTGSASASFSRE